MRKDKAVETIHDHYARQATPGVWAEVDELRERCAKLEAENAELLHDLRRHMQIANTECNEAQALRDALRTARPTHDQ